MTADEILPGIPEVLDYLEDKKIPFALGSASKNAPLILEKTNLIHRFTAIVDGNDVQKAKPDPEVFLIAAKKLHTEPKNCIVIEDALAGIQAAKNAGMYSIGIGDKDHLKEADINLNSTQELTTDLIKKIIA
jgi:beta-phosphoglucomutase